MVDIDQDKIAGEIVALYKKCRSSKIKKEEREKLEEDIVKRLQCLTEWIMRAKGEISTYQGVFIQVGKIIKFLEQ